MPEIPFFTNTTTGTADAQMWQAYYQQQMQNLDALRYQDQREQEQYARQQYQEYYRQLQQAYLPQHETREQILARHQRELAAHDQDRVEQERRRKLWAEEEQKRLDAKTKAAKVLREHLSPTQLKQYETEGHFDVVLKGRDRVDLHPLGIYFGDGEERIYRVKPGSRVEQLNQKGVRIASFCIHPANNYELPPDDIALSQKLMLEANESEFRRIAIKGRY